jgi:hypothetical protein
MKKVVMIAATALVLLLFTFGQVLPYIRKEQRAGDTLGT